MSSKFFQTNLRVSVKENQHAFVPDAHCVRASGWKTFQRRIVWFALSVRMLLCLCRKLTETDPPAASGYLASMAVWVVALLSPVASWICFSNALTSTLLSCTFTFMLVLLSEVSRNLEAPFAVNEGHFHYLVSTSGALPPSALQFKLNERLLAVSTTYRPHGKADIITHTEAAATAAAAMSSRDAFSQDPRVSTGSHMHASHAYRTGADTMHTPRTRVRHSSAGTAGTTAHSVRHGHGSVKGSGNMQNGAGNTNTNVNSNATTGSAPRSPLYSATVSSEVPHHSHHRSPTFSRSPYFGSPQSRSASDSPRARRSRSTPQAQARPMHHHMETQTSGVHQALDASRANNSLQSGFGSEAQGSVDINFLVPATVSLSTQPSADSSWSAPASIPGMQSMHGTHELNTSASAQVLSAATEQTVTMPAPESQPVPMNVRYQTDSTQGPTEAEPGPNSLSTSLSSELWVLGKLGGESPGHSRAESVGRESYVLSNEGSVSNTSALGRSPGTLLEASRSFQSRHTRVHSLESSGVDGSGLDNSGHLDLMGVPVMCPQQTNGGVHHVSSRSIVRNNEFEEVLSSSRALVHGQAANLVRNGDNVGRKRALTHNQDLSSASTLGEKEIAALTKLHPAASTTSKASASKRRSSNTSDVHGTQSVGRNSRNSAGVDAEAPSTSVGTRQEAPTGREAHGESGGNHENVLPRKENVDMKSASPTWHNGPLERSVENVGVFHCQEASSGASKEGSAGEARPRTPTSLVMWNTPADSA